MNDNISEAFYFYFLVHLVVVSIV